MSKFLLEDTFLVDAIDADKKFFARVSRMECTGQRYSTQLVCDYNSDLFKPTKGDKLEIVVTLTLNDDQTIDPNPKYNPRLTSRLLDEYEYVMSGKVFKIKQPSKEGDNIEIYISYGGLLMSLIGRPNLLDEFQIDQPLYLLIRKK